MTAQEKLSKKNNEGKFICVGLDTDLEKIPPSLQSSSNPVLEFNKAIIEKTNYGAAAYKINFAFYEKDGIKGIENLSETISFIPKDVLIIADAKRGDIGNTSEMYAKSVFDYFQCDSMTVNPYMGEDSVTPFLSRKDKIIFLLALTSNTGSNDFEKLKLDDGLFLFQKVIKKINDWNKNKNCGLVFGATNSEELKENMHLFKDLPVLLPGIGAQGGSLKDVIEVFKENNKKNFLINVSRGIIYKSKENDFADSAKKELEYFNNQVTELLI